MSILEGGGPAHPIETVIPFIIIVLLIIGLLHSPNKKVSKKTKKDHRTILMRLT